MLRQSCPHDTIKGDKSVGSSIQLHWCFPAPGIKKSPIEEWIIRSVRSFLLNQQDVLHLPSTSLPLPMCSLNHTPTSSAPRQQWPCLNQMNQCGDGALSCGSGYLKSSSLILFFPICNYSRCGCDVHEILSRPWKGCTCVGNWKLASDWFLPQTQSMVLAPQPVMPTKSTWLGSADKLSGQASRWQILQQDVVCVRYFSSSFYSPSDYKIHWCTTRKERPKSIT